MKRWLLLLALNSCFPFEEPRTYPTWTRTQSGMSNAGCLEVSGWAAQSGKQGLGLVVEATTQSDACAFAVRAAELDVGGEKVAAAGLPAAATLHRGQTVWVHLPFVFDGDRAWNEGRRTAEVRLAFDGGEVRWVFENRKELPIECEERPPPPPPPGHAP